MQHTIGAKSIKYIKNNRVKLIEQFASLAKYPPDKNPIALYMAGCPGAGKTEFSKYLIQVIDTHTVVRIDADEIRSFIPYYTGDNSDQVNSACYIGVEKLLDHCLQNDQNYILDGTFSFKYKKAKQNIERALKRDRTVVLNYIYQDPMLAWEFAKAREIKEGRSIPKKYFIDALFDSIHNANQVKKDLHKQVTLNLVVKNFDNELEKIHLNIDAIDSFVTVDYNKHDLIKKLP